MKAIWFGLLALVLSGCGLLPDNAPFAVPPEDSVSTQIFMEVVDADFAQREATLNVLERRLDALELRGNLTFVGSSCLLLNIQGDIADITALTNVGLLEFVDMSTAIPAEMNASTGMFVLTTEQVTRGVTPVGDNVLTNGGEPFPTVFTNSIIDEAIAQEQDFGAGGWMVAFATSRDGAEAFFEYTSAHIGTALGIVLDGVLLSAPTIQAPLSDSGIITGNFTESEARALAIQLNSGELPTPVTIINQADCE